MNKETNNREQADSDIFYKEVSDDAIEAMGMDVYRDPNMAAGSICGGGGYCSWITGC